MDKPIIGIIGTRNSCDEDPFLDYTKFVSNYPKRIIEAGGVPVGIFFPYDKFNIDSMKLCDGFVFTGGDSLRKSQIMAIDYAVKNHKPFLAICLGMQTMAAYEWFCKNYDFSLIDNYNMDFENNYLKKIEGHNNLASVLLDKIDVSKHKINLFFPLNEIFNSDYVIAPSFHNYAVKDGIFGDIFNVCAISDDGIIEAAAKSDEFMVGVQFHPEIEDSFLFDKLISEVSK